MAAEATGTIQGTAMDISVSKFELLKELTATQGVVERKTTIPILSNFLFEAANDRLTITATDLDLSLRTSCPAKVKREGACTIPARKLYDYVKLLPDGDITIKLLENHWVNIRCGPLEYENGRHGARQLPRPANISRDRRRKDSCADPARHDRAHDLRYLQRRVALHVERRSDGSQAGIDDHGRH